MIPGVLVRVRDGRVSRMEWDRSIEGVEASMDNDLDTLATVLSVRTDDSTLERRWLRRAREHYVGPFSFRPGLVSAGQTARSPERPRTHLTDSSGGGDAGDIPSRSTRHTWHVLHEQSWNLLQCGVRRRFWCGSREPLIACGLTACAPGSRYAAAATMIACSPATQASIAHLTRAA